MDSELKKTNDKLILQIVIAASLFDAQQWKNNIPMVEEQIVKISELVEIAKLTCFVRKHVFLNDWKFYMDVLLKEKKG